MARRWARELGMPSRRLLYSCQLLRRKRHGGLARRAPWPQGPGEADRGGRNLREVGAAQRVGARPRRSSLGAVRCQRAPAHDRAGAEAVRAFLAPGEPAQADYESLRAAVVEGTPLLSSFAVRFESGGLAALICSPRGSSPCFVAELLGAARPAWAPYADPRAEALADIYSLLTGQGGAERLVTLATAREA